MPEQKILTKHPLGKSGKNIDKQKYETLKKQARDLSVEIPAYVKAIIEAAIAKRPNPGTP